jgi:D-glycero-beta-D-manno-heptose 1-phosphate adenylyltransferase
MKSLLEKKQEFEETLAKKFIEPSVIEDFCKSLKKQGKKLVTLNGSFDLMHAGHLYILYEAKKQGDVLIVALNTDASIKAYKSKDRPIIDLENRKKMMSACMFVDYVTTFDETTPCQILSKICPDIHVNGAEYGDNCVEKQTVEACGGKMYLVDRIPGLSTTDVIKKIKNLCD